MNVAPITSLTFLRLFYNIFRNAAYELDIGDIFDSTINLQHLELQLEILACDANCSSSRPIDLAFVLICTEMDEYSDPLRPISGYAKNIQTLCKVCHLILLFSSWECVLVKY